MLRSVLPLTTVKGWQLHQMDIKNVFLQGELEEEVYMIQPVHIWMSYANSRTPSTALSKGHGLGTQR